MVSLFSGLTILPGLFQSKGDFLLEAPSTVLFPPVNHTLNVEFTVRSLQNFTGVVRFNLQASPSLNATTGLGVLLAFDPVFNTVGDVGYSFTVSPKTLGDYTLILTGTSSGRSHSISYSVTVQGLAFEASPGQLVMTQRSSANMTVTLTSLNGYSGNLTLGIGSPYLWITLISPTLNCSACNGLGPPYPLHPNGTVDVIVNVKWQSNGANSPGLVNQMTLGVDGLFAHTFTVTWN
jgi:hypothetical protein